MPGPPQKNRRTQGATGPEAMLGMGAGPRISFDDARHRLHRLSCQQRPLGLLEIRPSPYRAGGAEVAHHLRTSRMSKILFILSPARTMEYEFFNIFSVPEKFLWEKG